MARVPLDRPAPPSLPRRLTWPTRAVAVFGEAEGALADALLEAWPEARRLDVVLRHAEGSERSAGRVLAHPDALADALAAVGPSAPTVGVGGAFAAAVEAELVVFSGPIHALLALPPTLREVARNAALQLEVPRPEAMRVLGATLRGRPSPL